MGFRGCRQVKGWTSVGSSALFAAALFFAGPFASAQEQRPDSEGEFDCTDQDLLARIFTSKYVTETQACEIQNQRNAFAARVAAQSEEIFLLSDENNGLRDQIEDLGAQLATARAQTEMAIQDAEANTQEFEACSAHRDRLIAENVELLSERDDVLRRQAAILEREEEIERQLQAQSEALDGQSAFGAGAGDRSQEANPAAQDGGNDSDGSDDSDKASAERIELAAKEVAALQLALEACETQKAGLNAQIDALNKQVRGLEVEVRTLEEVIEAASATDLRNSVLQTELESSQLALENALLAKNEAEARLADAEQANAGLTEQLATAQAAALRQSNRVMAVRREKSIVDGSLLEKDEEISTLRTLLLEANAQNAAQDKQDEEIAGLRAQLLDANGQNETLSAEVARLTAELAAKPETDQRAGELASQLVAKDVEIERLTTALSEKSNDTEVLEQSSQAMRRVTIALNQQASDVGFTMRNGRMVVPNTALFAAGSATLMGDAKGVLDPLAEAIGDLIENDDNSVTQFMIVGHADKTPIGSSRYPSNWELSAHRAAAVVRGLVERGIDPARLLAAGQSQYDPLDDGDSREAFAKNRRIEVFAF